MITISERLATCERALSTEELAVLRDMKPWTLREWIRTDRLRAHTMGDEWKIDPADAIAGWRQQR
jgi:hypothetical protein